jgi:protein ImuA
MPAASADIIRQLQREILPLQGFKPPTAGRAVDFHLGPLEAAFPNHRFPTGAVHEFISQTRQQSAATHGFLGGLLAPLLKNGGVCLWIGGNRSVFPPGFPIYGVSPDRVLFLDLPKEKDRCWAMEEALKCEALAAVVGEISEISFTDSRRLQLAVEQSRVTGMLLRHAPRTLGTVASVARWEIIPLPSEPEEGLPGIGFPRWQTTLLKVRNGRPGSWVVEWSAGRFQFPEQAAQAAGLHGQGVALALGSQNIAPPAPRIAASVPLPAVRAPHKRRTG